MNLSPKWVTVWQEFTVLRYLLFITSDSSGFSVGYHVPGIQYAECWYMIDLMPVRTGSNLFDFIPVTVQPSSILLANSVSVVFQTPFL